VEQIAVVAEQRAEFSLADANGVLQHSLKHRLQLTGRTADHLENLRRRGLLLQRLAQLVEQARIFDSDDGLLREIADQLDLFVCEGSYLLAVDGNRADHISFLKHRHHERSADTANVSRDNGQWITVEVGTARAQVSGLDRLPRFGGAGQSDIRAGVEQGSGPQPLQVSGRQSTVECCGSEGISFAQP
jgi:hypothetical protein